MNKITQFLALTVLIVLITACKHNEEQKSEVQTIASTEPNISTSVKVPLTKDFKGYWYNGEAEITSFQLSQERYGEIREGSAVLIYVTEDFLPQEQVKADNYNSANIPVLKLNTTKKFYTGIYPYSIMESSFYPVGQQSHALKISASVQEWCGQVYAQLNNREQFEVMAHSYFEGEADESYQLEKSFLENEIWNLIRINPDNLPIGDLQMIPSLEFNRLRHKPIKAYSVTASLDNGSYTLTYPDLKRKLVISFNTEFPFEIMGWEESNLVGYGSNQRVLTTKAKRLKTIRSPYWSKNSNADLPLREELMLK